MKGICKKVDLSGDVTHIFISPDAGSPTFVTVEEYSDQDGTPPVASLPVCADPKKSDA